MSDEAQMGRQYGEVPTGSICEVLLQWPTAIVPAIWSFRIASLTGKVRLLPFTVVKAMLIDS